VVPVDRSPFLIGRGSECALRLEVPGVWERHLTLEVEPGEGLIASAQAGALTRVRGREGELSRARVRQGEELEVGAAVIRVLLAPVRRRWQGFWEWVLWGTFGVVGLVQVVLLGWLLGGG